MTANIFQLLVTITETAVFLYHNTHLKLAKFGLLW